VTRLSIALYEKAVQVLLPLPAKSHYSFNLRQVSELVQGLTLVPSKKVTAVSEEKNQLSLLMRLWVHESLRVFSDRLVNEEDKQVFTQCLKDTVEEDTQQARYLFI
jgi:dynein heavy chain